MGTLLQEFGHDIVLLHFIDRVLARRKQEIFFIVSPAVGPKLDVHYLNSKEDEYTSAFNVSRALYVPEFSIRAPIPQAVLDELDKESDYRVEPWYQHLTDLLGRDLKSVVKTLVADASRLSTGSLPDIMGVGPQGNTTVVAEIKFEGLSKEALAQVKNQANIARAFRVPYMVVVPAAPAYGRGPSDRWIGNNFPEEARVFRFTLGKDVLIPKKAEIEFIEVGE